SVISRTDILDMYNLLQLERLSEIFNDLLSAEPSNTPSFTDNSRPTIYQPFLSSSNSLLKSTDSLHTTSSEKDAISHQPSNNLLNQQGDQLNKLFLWKTTLDAEIRLRNSFLNSSYDWQEQFQSILALPDDLRKIEKLRNLGQDFVCAAEVGLYSCKS